MTRCPADIEWARNDEMALGMAELIWFESGHRGSLLAADRDKQNEYLGLALDELSAIFCEGHA